MQKVPGREEKKIEKFQTWDSCAKHSQQCWGGELLGDASRQQMQEGSWLAEVKAHKMEDEMPAQEGTSFLCPSLGRYAREIRNCC